MLILSLALLSLTTAARHAAAQAAAASGPTDPQALERRHTIGSSLFLLGNLSPDEPPGFGLVNYGYQVTRKDAVFVEAITWTYYEPLGTYGSSKHRYPGKVRAIGIGAGYQRFLWRRLYATVQATPFRQQYFDAGNRAMQAGFQLYLQSRLGYRLARRQARWFVEPSAAFNYWPVNTNVPSSFQAVDRGTRNYFLFEPGLHFGYRF